MAQVWPLLAVVVFVAAVSLWYRRTNGAAAATTATFSADDRRLLGIGQSTTAVVFTAPGCAPCVPAKRIVDEVGARHGIPVVAVDVGEHAAIATRHHVYRAPTTFVIDQRGRALVRITGVPRAEDLDRILGAESLAV